MPTRAIISFFSLTLLTHYTLRLAAEGIPEVPVGVYGELRDRQGARLTSGTLSWTYLPTNGVTAITFTTPLTNLLDQFSFLLMPAAESAAGSLTVSTNVLILTNPPLTYNRANVTLDGLPIYLKYPSQRFFTFNAANRGKLERVDLVLSPGDQDANSNGLPDWWENLYFGGNANPNADSDGDGLSNLAEFKTGTNPTNATSALRFTYIAPDAFGGIDLQWTSATNGTYILQRADTFSAPFVDIVTDIGATPLVNSFIDPTANGRGPYFYRLQLQEGNPSTFDGDLNGLPDEWERRYFDGIRVDPLADPDGDGMNTLAEYRAGTDPTNPASVFKIRNASRAPQGGMLLTWSSVVNKHYTVSRSTNLLTGYQPVAEDIFATPPANLFYDPTAVSGGPFFYRVMVQP